MKKIFLMIFIFTVCLNAFAFDIAKKGKPTAVVVLAKDATEPEKYACQEFVRYIEKISGAKLSIFPIPQKNKNNIYIGQTEIAKSFCKGFDWHTLADDGILIKTGKNYLILAGDRPRGTIYSVYELLENLGVVFLTAKEEYIPKSKNISVDLNIKYKPPFMSRDLYTKDCIGNAQYNCKVRCNGFFFNKDTNGAAQCDGEKYGGNIDLLLWVHSFRILMNPDNYKDHPEYFSLINGERVPSWGAQICFSNPNVVKEVTKNVLRELDMRPHTKIISVSQNDNENKCQCENCKALYEKYGNSGALLTLVNEVAREVKKKYPNTFVETISYNWTREAPKNIVPEDNVIIRVCTSFNDHAKPINSDTNKDFYKSLTKWSEISKSLYIWDYVINFYNSYVYFPNIQNLSANFKLYRDNKVKAFFAQDDYTNENFCMNHLRSYLIGKLMWNPDIDFEKEKMKFLKLYYGEAAEDINEFIRIGGEAALRETDPPIFMSMYSRYNSFYTADDFISAFKALYRGLEKVKHNPVLKDRILVDLYSFQGGFLYAPTGIREKVYAENILEYNSNEAFLNMFYDFAKSHGDTNYSEGIKLEDSDYNVNNKNKMSSAGKPVETNGIPDNQWVDMQENDFFYPVGDKVAKVVDEKISSSNGLAAYVFADSKDWGIQKELKNLFLKDEYKSCDLYISYRIDGGKTDEIAFYAGVYDKDNKNVPFQFTGYANDTTTDMFITKKMGTLDLTGSSNINLYICGGDYPNSCKGIYIDRVFAIYNPKNIK